MEVVIIIIAIVLLLVGIIVTALITKNVAIEQYKKSEEVKVGNAEEKARGIIDDALKTAETKKREALLEMRLSVNPKREEQNCNDMKNAYYRRRKLWIRSQMHLKRKKIS